MMLKLIQENRLNIALVLLAISIQTQITLFGTETYEGLRLNLTDIALPFIGFYIVIKLLQKKTTWPKFYIPYALPWLLILSLVFVLALGHSYLLTGKISNWALINKTIGWGILCAYFLLGGWLAQKMKPSHLDLFFKTSLLFLISVLLWEIINFMLSQYQMPAANYFIPPSDGFMGNKNAFIFLILCLFGLSNSVTPSRFYRYIGYSLWFLVPLILTFTGGRSGMIIFAILIVLFILLKNNKDWVKKIVLFTLGLFCIFIINNTANYKIRFFQLQVHELSSLRHIDDAIQGESLIEIEKEIKHAGDSMRLKILDTTFNMIKENPLLGSGLGSAKIAQEKQWGEQINIIDNTPLWLMAETGLIGLTLFLGFYFVCAKTLYKNAFNKENDELARNFNKSILIMLLIFGMMSIFHELLYTRFLWLFMGMALAYPLKRAAPHQT